MNKTIGQDPYMTDAVRAVLDEMKRQGCKSEDINRFYLDNIAATAPNTKVVRKRSLLTKSRVKSIETIRDNKTAQKCYEDARTRFTIFHVLNYIMYTEALEAFDMMEEEGLMRQDIKRSRRMCESEWTRYQNATRAMNQGDDWYLLQDYCMAAHESIDSDLTIMLLSFSNYLLKSDTPHHAIIAQLSVALKIADLLIVLWPKYFETYKNICALDFTPYFAYADMHLFIHYLKDIAERLTHNRPTIDYSKDQNCVNAMSALEYKMAKDSFLDDAAFKALQYSDKYRPLFEKLKNEKQQEQ